MRAHGVLTLVLLLAATAVGQEAPEPPAAPAAPAAEKRPVPEPSRTWADWSRAFAAQLLARGRRLEAVEEMYAAALFDPNEVDLLCEAAVILVDDGGRSRVGIRAGTPYEIFAGQCIALAIARGAGPLAPPEDAEPGPDGVVPGGRFGDARLAYALGRLAWARQDFVDAADQFADAYYGEFDPRRSLDWYFRGTVNAAPTRYVNGLLDEGIAELEIVLDLAPDHAERKGALINLADGYRRRQEAVPAQAILERVLADDPNGGEAWYTMGLVLRDQGKTEEAADALERSVDALARTGGEFTLPLLDRVELLQKLARFDEAERELRRYMELKPDEPEAIYRLSRIRRDAGDLDTGVLLARRALRLERDSLRFLENLKTMLHRRGAPEDEEELVEVTARYDERLAELKAADKPQPAPEEDDGGQPDDPAPEPGGELGGELGGGGGEDSARD